MQWISVKKYLPGDEKWKIIRTIDKEETDFYFMAYYHTNSGWEYFDDDKDYEETMTITHWCDPIDGFIGD